MFFTALWHPLRIYLTGSFHLSTGQKQHGDDMVEQAPAHIENNISERISAEELSSRFAIGRRNFDRRLIKATGNTPVEYAQRVKTESAKKGAGKYKEHH